LALSSRAILLGSTQIEPEGTLMADKLTWDEIKSRYPDEWVVLVDLDADDVSDEVHAGVVFAHSKNERELLAATKDALAGKSRH
jgi:hypothetical protein